MAFLAYLTGTINPAKTAIDGLKIEISPLDFVTQRSVTGLSLDPMNLAVIALAGWVDMGMHHVYRQQFFLGTSLS